MKRKLLFISAMLFVIALVRVDAQTISPRSVSGGLKTRQVESINSSATGLSVVAYYTVWSYCDMPPQDVDYSAITHLVLFGGASSGITPNVNTAPYFPPATPGNNSFSTTFTGTPGWCANPISGKNHVQIMRDSCNAHGVKLLLDLGGEYGTPASAFQALIADTTKFDTYINAVDSITRHNVYGVQFDGVSIDWEFPNTQGSASVHTAGSPLYNYDLFLKKLWTKLQTWTPSPGIIGEAFPTWFWWNHSTKTGPIVDTSTIRKYISLVNLMEYGMENTSAISHYSPLYANPAASQETWDFRGINEWSGAGVVKSQINTLIPFESISMTDNSGISPVAIGHAGGSASWIGLRDIPSGVTVHYDSISMSNWAETGKSFYSYENATSLAAKVQYARSKNIGGVGIWELWRGWLPNAPAGQHDPLLQALKSAVGGIVIPSDTIKPVVTLTSPANGDTVTGTITVTANATDNVSIASVQLLVNGVMTATGNTAPYTFTWNTTNLSGSQTLVVKATDESGNSATTQPITVVLKKVAPDTIKPVVALSSPVNGATVSGNVTVTANASDNVGVTRVDFLVNGSLLGSTTSSPYKIQWNTAGLSGSNALQAKAYDAAGNVGASPSISMTVNNSVVDTSAPVISITSPTNSANLSGSVTVSVNATDNVGVTRVDFLINGVKVGSDSTTPYVYNWNTSNQVGSNVLSAKAYDAAGNVGTAQTITVTVSAPPVGNGTPVSVYTDAIQSPWIDASWSDTNNFSSTDVAYTGNYSIRTTQTGWGALRFHSGSWGSPVYLQPTAYSQVTFAVYSPSPGLVLNVSLGKDTNSVFTGVISQVIQTNHWAVITLPISQLDPSGLPFDYLTIQNNSGSTVTYYVDNILFAGQTSSVVDTIPPTVSIVSPSSGADVSGTVTVNANASAHVKLKGVQFACDGANIGSLVTSSPFSCAFNSMAYSNGTHTITATAQDTAGLVNNASVNVTVSNTITTNSAISANLVRDNFDTSANRISIAGRNKWINIANQTGKGTLQIYNSAVQPYNKYGIGTYGGVAWDSLMNAGSQIGVVVRQKGGNGSNASFFIYVRMTNENLSTGNGYRLRYLDNPNGLDQLSLERVSNGVNAVTLSSINKEIVTGDTLSVRINNDAAHSLVVYVDRDSVLSATDTVYNPSSWYVWLRGCVFKTPVRIDNFMIANLAQLPSTIFTDPTNGNNGLPAPKGQTIPREFSLFQNYPNPFNPSTRIQFVVPNPSVVTLKIYNLLGQEVSTLVDNVTMDAGTQTVEFNASQFSSGVYFYRITVDQFASPDDGIASRQFTSLRKMMLVK